MAIWTPVDRRHMEVAVGNNAFGTGATSTDETINVSGVPVASGELRGLVVTTNVSGGGSHAARVKVYASAAKTDLLYEGGISFGSGTSGSDTISPIPLFGPATYTLTDEHGSGTDQYWVRFFIKATG